MIGLENLSTSVVIIDLYLYWSIIFPAVSWLTLRTIFVSSLCVLNIYSLADHDSFFIVFLIDYPSPFPLFLAISLLCLLISLFNSSLSPFPSVHSVHHCQILLLQTQEPLWYSFLRSFDWISVFKFRFPCLLLETLHILTWHTSPKLSHTNLLCERPAPVRSVSSCPRDTLGLFWRRLLSSSLLICRCGFFPFFKFLCSFSWLLKSTVICILRFCSI